MIIRGNALLDAGNGIIVLLINCRLNSQIIIYQKKLYVILINY